MDSSANKKIHHDCESGIEKSVPRITDWHHDACRVMTNGDPDGRMFLSHAHRNNGFFFLVTTKYLIEKEENPEYAGGVILILNDVTERRVSIAQKACGCSIYYLFHGLVYGYVI